MINNDFYQQAMSAGDLWADQICTLKDAYAPRDPLKFVVNGLFTLPSLSIIYGAPGSLKSFLLGYFAVNVAAGLPCLGRAVIQSPVMWIDFDNGKRRTDERFEALARAEKLPDDTPFYYVSMPSPWLNAGELNDIEALKARIIERKIKFVCIDNLGLIAVGTEENSANMIKIMGNLRYLSEKTGAAIVLIHHQRKRNGSRARAGDALRGHSSIESAIDLSLWVDREEGTNTITIESTKTRDVDVSPFGAEFRYEHKPGSTELLSATFSKIEIEDKSSNKAIEAAILEAIRENPKFTQQKIVKTVKPILRAGVNRIRSTYNRMKYEGRLNYEEV